LSRDDRYVRHLERTITRLEQQNRDLLDRIMFLTGQTWTPAPAEVVERPLPDENDEEWVPDPSQLIEEEPLGTIFDGSGLLGARE
jgi:hypothetical protein